MGCNNVYFNERKHKISQILTKNSLLFEPIVDYMIFYSKSSICGLIVWRSFFTADIAKN